MEPVTIFMLSVTVKNLGVEIGSLLRSAWKLDEHVDGLAHGLTNLKRIIDQVYALSEDPQSRDALENGSAQPVFAAMKEDFEDCRRFIEALLETKKKTSTKTHRLIKLASMKWHEGANDAHNVKLRDHLSRAKLCLHILSLYVSTRGWR